MSVTVVVRYSQEEAGMEPTPEYVRKRIAKMTQKDLFDVADLVASVEDRDTRCDLTSEWAQAALRKGLRTDACGGCGDSEDS